MASFLQPSSSAVAADASSPVRTTCGADQLEFGLANGPGSAGRGSDVVLIANVGKKTCDIKGFPRLQFLTATSQLPVALSHFTYTFQVVPPREVRLASGQVASFGIGFGDNSNPKSDTPQKCLVTTTYVVIDSHKYDIPFSWDACLGGMRLGVTSIQSGPFPVPFNGG
jgi:hypothetical protein